MGDGASDLPQTLLRSTLFLAGAAIFVRALTTRIQSPRHSVNRIAWSLVLLQGVLFVRLPVMIPWYGPSATSTSAAPGAGPMQSSEDDLADEMRSVPFVPPESSEVGNDARSQRAGGAVPVANSQTPGGLIHQLHWSFFAVLIWLAGMAAVMVHFLFDYVRFVRGLSPTRPAEPAWSKEWAAMLAERRVGSAIPLRISDDAGPMLCRFPRGYQVIVPARFWRALTAGQRRAILRHELAHYQRGDVWKSLSVRLLAVLHWFNPFAWLAVRKFDEYGEWACDNAATGSSPDARHEYARALLYLGEHQGRPLVYQSMVHAPPLSSRIRHLLGSKESEDSTIRRYILVALPACLALLAVLRFELVAQPPAALPLGTVAQKSLSQDYEWRVAGGGDRNRPPAGLVAILGDSKFKDWNRIKSVAFSPDGKTVASAGLHVILWDAASGERTNTMQGQGYANAVAYSPGGHVLATAWSDGAVRMIDAHNGKLLHSIAAHQGGSHCLDFGPYGRLLASGGADSIVRLWDVSTGKQIHVFAGHKSRIRSLAFSPDGKLLASGAAGIIWLWDIERKTKLRTIEAHIETRDFGKYAGQPLAGAIYALAFSPDGQTLASGAADRWLKLWDVANGVQQRAIEVMGTVRALAFSPDGHTLSFSTKDDVVKLWDLAEDVERCVLQGHSREVNSLAFSPDGKALVTGSSDRSVKRWDVADGVELGVSGRSGPSESVAFSPDGGVVVWGARDGVVRVRDTRGGDTVARQLHTGPVRTIAFHPSGELLATGGGPLLAGELLLWEAGTGRVLTRLEGHRFQVESAIFSPDGRLLASVSHDGALKLWDVGTGEEMQSLTVECGGTAFGPAGKLLAYSDGQYTIALRALVSGETKLTLSGRASGYPVSLAFDPLGRWIAAPGMERGTVMIWNAHTGAKMHLLWGHASRITAVTASSTGRLLASSSTDGTVRVWNSASGTLREEFQVAPAGAVIQDVAIHPDESHIATANGNGTIYVVRLTNP